MSQMVEFSRPDGQTAPGYLAEPPAPVFGTPGIVLVEEWWGLDDRIKQTADRLAGEGFAVLVPDLFRGRTAAVGDEANHLLEGLDFEDAATQDLAGAAAYLRSQGATRVGVMGFCIGGDLVLRGLMRTNVFDAGSAWYGFPPPDEAEPAAIRVPVQGHWGNEDSFYTIDGVEALERQLKAANVPYEFHRYDAKHGFFNEGAPGEAGLGHYSREDAETAWKRAVEFFRRTLQ